MATNPQRRSSSEDMVLRRAGGQWLKGLREARALSQTEFVRLLGPAPRHYSFISQIEIGVSRIPPSAYAAWADALGVPRAHFGMQLLRFYDPSMYALLAGDGADTAEPPKTPPETEAASPPG